MSKKSSPGLKKVVIGALLVAFVASLVWMLQPAPTAVTLAPVQQGYFAESINEEGRTHLQNTYNIAVPISGFLQRVQLNTGDRVTAGMPVFYIEPLPTPALDARSREQAREQYNAAQSRLESAQAELENRVAEAEFAAGEYQRYQQLAAEGAISQTELDRARNTLQRANSSQRSARAAVGAATAELENTRLMLAISEGTRSSEGSQALAISAPINGVVLRRFRCCEGVVTAGEAILEVGDLSELEVRIDLLSQDAVRVQPGMPVRIERWGGEDILAAQVRLVEPAGFTKVSALGIDEQRVSVYATLLSPPSQWEQLGEGYRVETQIITWESNDALYIPVSALFRHDNQWHVFLAHNNRVSLTQITVGRRSGIYTEVITGLNAQDTVVTHPPADLRDGDKIRAL